SGRRRGADPDLQAEPAGGRAAADPRPPAGAAADRQGEGELYDPGCVLRSARGCGGRGVRRGRPLSAGALDCVAGRRRPSGCRTGSPRGPAVEARVKLLRDTCTFLWLIPAARELSVAARARFADPANDVFLSAASAWEIAIKWRRGRL